MSWLSEVTDSSPSGFANSVPAPCSLFWIPLSELVLMRCCATSLQNLHEFAIVTIGLGSGGPTRSSVVHAVGFGRYLEHASENEAKGKRRLHEIQSDSFLPQAF